MRIVKLSSLSEKERKKVLEEQEQRYQQNKAESQRLQKEANDDFVRRNGNGVTQTSHTTTYRDIYNAMDSRKQRSNFKRANNVTLWDTVKTIASNTGRIMDNVKSGSFNGILGLGQTLTRDARDIDNFSTNVATGITNRLSSLFGSKGRVANMFVNASVESLQNRKNEDRQGTIQIMQNAKERNKQNIQKNIFDTKQTGSVVGTKLAELAPSVGQQIPGMALNSLSPVASFAYFKASSEADYYDDAKARGMSENESKLYSKLMSYVEASTEQLSVGNITAGGKAVKTLAQSTKGAGLKTGLKAGIDVFKNTAKRESATAIKNALKDYGIGIAEEAFQEAITEPIQEYTALCVAGKDKADFSNMWNRMLQSGVDGALSSAIIAGANMGVNSCIGVATKINNGEEISKQEYQTAIKDASKKVDVQKLTVDEIKKQTNKFKDYNTNQTLDDNTQSWLNKAQNIVNQNQQNIDNKVINQENKIAQNPISQTENQIKQQTINKLSKVRQFYDENTYNQMKEFIETAPNEKALNQINEDMKTETKNKLETIYKSERFTESKERKQTYAKYQRENNTKGIQYDNNIANHALDAISANRNGRRTVGQWKQVAEQIGLEVSNLSKEEIDNIAYGSWFDLQPNKNITRYDNRTKEQKGFEKFTSDDWVNTIYESAKKQKIQQLNTVLNSNIANNEKKLYNNIALGEKMNVPIEDVLKLKDDRGGGHRSQEEYESLKQDIKENGIKNPIELVKNNDESINIQNGNHRLQVAQELGMKEVPIKFVESWDNIGLDKDSSESKFIERMEGYNDRNNRDSGEVNFLDGRVGIIERNSIDNRNESENRKTTEGNDRVSNGTQENNNRPSSNTTLEKNIKELEQSSSFNLKQIQENTRGEAVNWNEIERPEEDRKFRKHYKSIIESDNTTTEAKSIAKELMGTDTYVPETNKGQLAKADERIANSSPEAELQSLISRTVNNEKISSVDIATGERLIQYFSKTGNKEQLQEAIQATALAGTSAGQTVQALSILNHQTPQGQVTWLQRSVDKMNKELAKKKGGTITTDENGNMKVINNQGKDISKKVNLFDLTPEMTQKIMNSENQEQMYKNIDEVYEELGQQVPKSMIEKIDTWRYFSMLANIRTHARNMIGNVAMGKMQRVKDKLAGGIEDVVSKFDSDMERTKTLRLANKKTKEFAKTDFKNIEVQSRLELNENKYNPQSRLQNSRRTFKHDALENTLGKLFNLNDSLLEAEDGIGLKAGYQKALSDYITANKIDVDKITDKQLNKARNYAIQQAKEATFHQANAIASAVTQFSNKNNITKFFTDAILPFKKTPMNVAKSGMEYSPLQIAKSATIDVVNLRKGKISINQYIDNLSKGMTGTGIALAGYALANAGILKASGSDDQDKEKYDEEQGKQSYSIEVGGKTYSLDWLAPTGIPLFIGAETHKLFNQTSTEKSTEKKSDESKLEEAIKSASNIANAGATAINPMTEMSMISGLTSVLSSYNKENALGDMMTNAGKSYVNQFVPTFLGQVAKTGDEYERSTKSTATGTIGKAVDQTVNQIKNKVPGLRQTLPIKTDIWGKDVKQEVNLPLRAFNNFINPATVKGVSTDEVDKELNKLYDVNSNRNILPDTLQKKLTINNQDYRLTNKEYAEQTKNYGKTSYELIGNLIKTSDYKNLTQEQKEEAISNIYSYVKEQNKVSYARKVGEEIEQSTLYKTMEAIKNGGGNQSEYLNYLSRTKGLDKASEKNKVLAKSNYSSTTKEIIYTNTTGKDDKLYNDLLKNTNIDIDEYLNYKNKVSKKAFKSDKDKNGKTITGSAKKKTIDYLNKNISGVGNRLLIAGKSYALQNNERQALVKYINKITDTKEEKLDIYKQLDKNFTVSNGKVYMKKSRTSR